MGRQSDRRRRPETSWLIDPAAHGGHREFDLAMMRLFGGFGDECFAAYDDVNPLASGWPDRVALHQIAPLVVHAVKFGGGYVAAATQAIHTYAELSSTDRPPNVVAALSARSGRRWPGNRSAGRPESEWAAAAQNGLGGTGSSAGRPSRASEALLHSGSTGDLATEPTGGGERLGGLDRRELDFDEAEPIQRAAEQVDLGGELLHRKAMAGLLQAPVAGVSPKVFGLVEVEGYFDLDAFENVAATLDRQPGPFGGDPDAHRDITVDGDVTLTQRRPRAEPIGLRRLVGDPLAFDLGCHESVSSPRVGPLTQSLSRWASQARGIDTTITNVAITLTNGTLFGRLMLARIHCGNVS